MWRISPVKKLASLRERIVSTMSEVLAQPADVLPRVGLRKSAHGRYQLWTPVRKLCFPDG
jgi:hypothetical protein